MINGPLFFSFPGRTWRRPTDEPFVTVTNKQTAVPTKLHPNYPSASRRHYTKLAKLLRPSIFPHTSHARSRRIPAAYPAISGIGCMDEVVWNVALGSAALGGTAAGSGGALNNPSSSWTPALDELVFTVRLTASPRCVTLQRHNTWSSSGTRGPGDSYFTPCYTEKFFRRYFPRISTCPHGTVSRSLIRVSG